MGLTTSELRALRPRASVIDSDGFGVMFHGAGVITPDGRTRLTCDLTSFLDKGQEVDVTVDGSKGASVVAGNGVIFQLMEDDDPGPVMTPDGLLNTGVYTEQTGPATRVPSWDVAAVHDEDAVATFTSTTLEGDFYNAFRGGAVPSVFGPGPDGKDLVLNFASTKVTGVISSSASHNSQATLTSADYELMGKVANSVEPAVNNGVIVALSGTSVWKVTGTSHLTSLTVGPTASVTGANHRAVTMTVDGVATPIVPGTMYAGAIVVTVA